MTPQRFSQLTDAGVDPYNKTHPGRRPVWRYAVSTRVCERDAEVFSAYIREMQDSFSKMLNRLADQLLNSGYDPYNHCNGARITFTFSIPQQTRKL